MLLPCWSAEGDEQTLTYLVIEQREVILSFTKFYPFDGCDHTALLELGA